MIYTRFGTPVKLLTCEVSEETSVRGDKFLQHWVTAEQTGPSIGATEFDKFELGRGRMILDGKQFSATELRADNGWGEILAACNGLRPKEPYRDTYGVEWFPS